MSGAEHHFVIYSVYEVATPKNACSLRHAESMRNYAKKGSTYFADDAARNLVKGIPDHNISITEKGVLQAKKTGDGIRKKFGRPDYLYHSGYKRTIQTAEYILDAYTKKERAQIKIRQNLFIRERDPGYSYDMTEAEVKKHFPWLAEYWDTFGGFFSRPPGGESLADTANRIYDFINMLFRDRNDKKVFVVTHGHALRCFRFLLERWGYEQALAWPKGQSPKNCGVTVYTYNKKEKRLVLKEYNTIFWDEK